jgi:hypothetical protein
MYPIVYWFSQFLVNRIYVINWPKLWGYSAPAGLVGQLAERKIACTKICGGILL